jgi:hypothetical protein
MRERWSVSQSPRLGSSRSALSVMGQVCALRTGLAEQIDHTQKFKSGHHESKHASTRLWWRLLSHAIKKEWAADDFGVGATLL